MESRLSPPIVLALGGYAGGWDGSSSSGQWLAGAFAFWSKHLCALEARRATKNKRPGEKPLCLLVTECIPTLRKLGVRVRVGGGVVLCQDDDRSGGRGGSGKAVNRTFLRVRRNEPKPSLRLFQIVPRGCSFFTFLPMRL